MNDEWSHCPICFENYSLEHRPTTFNCGHSVCINHTIGTNRLLKCPICRYSLERREQYQVSYNLEEAARLFQAIKHRIDWSTVTLSSAPTADDDQHSAAAMIHRDEVYARRVQAELEREARSRPQGGAQARAATAGATAPIQSRPAGNAKRCGHQCDLDSTARCCTCSDARPHRPHNAYETYVDGYGMADRVARNEYYCSTCKRR